MFFPFSSILKDLNIKKDGRKQKDGTDTSEVSVIEASDGLKMKKPPFSGGFFASKCGTDETRTRDLLRDRQAL